MTIRKHISLLVFLISSISVFILYYSNYSHRPGMRLSQTLEMPRMLSRSPHVSGTDFQPHYAILSPQCKMLNPSPWNESIKKYLNRPPSLTCSRLPLLTFIDQQENLTNVLKINKQVIRKYKVRSNHILKCCYNVIKRINQSVQNYNTSADSLYELSKCINFTDQALLSNETEFILVKCESFQKGKQQGKEVYKDVHSVVPILPEASIKMKKFEERRRDEGNDDDNNNSKTKSFKSDTKRLNVIIIGIDSVSKLNLRRIMPETLKYLQERNWVELKGYNKIGENTFPNMMAILSGEPTQKLEEICLANFSRKMDDCPTIWKEYNRKGYITLYAEDTPSISTFNLLRTGFVNKPTDYYMRPFMLAAHELLRLKSLNGLPVCLGPVLIVDHILNYAKKFFRAFNNYNYFSLLWLNSLSHNDVNAPKALDNSIHRFLNDLTAFGTYENSLILLLSDHGVRFGNIRESFLGYLEERLPFMFIWFPIWFRKKYPEKYNNLLTNQNRLTSPYDIYVTIKRLLDDKVEVKESAQPDREPVSTACPNCKGLLEVQPPNRTCADASIDLNWCLCSEFRDVDVKDKTSVQIGKFFYKFIVNQTNELMKKENVTKSLCSKWKFLKIFKTQEIVPQNKIQQYSLRNAANKEILRFKDQHMDSNIKIFVIIIELNPGKTKFESTVQMQTRSGAKDPNFAFLEPPKRLDSIYKTSKCVNDLLLKHYCYCVRR